jgi:putative ABC transport system permease protein
MDQTQRWLADEYPESSRGHGIRVVSLHEEVVGRVRPVLLLLFGAVGLVLLAACANVANLLMARGASRTREFAIRGALGAGRARVVRQLLTESLLIGVIGGVAGFLVAFWSLDSLVALLPPDMPRADSVRIDVRVLLFSAGLSLATSLLFGLAPALRASRVGEHLALRDSDAGLDTSGRHPVRAGLVVVQVALAVTLLIGGGLMIRSMARLTRVAPGFRVDHLLTFRLNLGWEHRSTSLERVDLYTRVLDRLQALPGVESISASSTLPMGPIEGYRFTIEGRPVPSARADWPEARLSSISSGYFATMGIPLLRGRLFDDRDQRDSRPGAVIVNEALARAYFQCEDPLGKRITSEVDINDTDPKVFQIVGIVGDDHARGLDLPEQPCLYSPYRQQTFPYMSFALRTSVEPSSLVAAVRKAVAEVTATEAIYQTATMEELVSRSRGLVSRRFPMVLLALFAGLAIVLATTGLYGALSFAVVQRTREIGQRMSLGATPADVQSMILRQGMALVAGGLAVGLAVSLAASRLLRSLLFETSPWDPVAIGGVAAFVVAVAVCASYFPARRAARVDPMVTLRCA